MGRRRRWSERVRLRESGQTTVITALALFGLIVLLVVILSTGALFVQQQQLRNGAHAAASAGAGALNDVMLTQVSIRQTEAAENPCEPIGPACTPTPAPEDYLAWLTESDRDYIGASPLVMTPAAAEALWYAAQNGISPESARIVVQQSYAAAAGAATFSVEISHRPELFVPIWLLPEDFEIKSKGQWQVPLR